MQFLLAVGLMSFVPLLPMGSLLLGHLALSCGILVPQAAGLNMLVSLMPFRLFMLINTFLFMLTTQVIKNGPGFLNSELFPGPSLPAPLHTTGAVALITESSKVQRFVAKFQGLSKMCQLRGRGGVKWDVLPSPGSVCFSPVDPVLGG